MIARFIFILFTISAFPVSVVSDNLIPWRLDKKLNWEDFKGTPPVTATNAALTSSTILISFSYSKESLNFDIKCAFDRSKSWGRIKNDHILSHEQGHFDITEIHARKLYKALKEYKFRKASVSSDINLIYEKVVNDLQLMQNEYDKESDHSRNYAVQAEWEARISENLSQYKNFAVYAK